MTWTFAKVAAAGALAAIPVVAVGVPACATTVSGDISAVLSAPLPAEPPTEPEPPAPAEHGEYYSPNDYDDWWYNGGADGGGGGGGG